ncbi:MAG: hypothetical protein NTV46_13525 [Verrucomicrobia bacterium]|nr:hypothetical protein [Verrucomicrobiota bacterium]
MSTTHITKSRSKKVTSKKTTANNRIPQMSERLKGLDNERSESMSRLQDSLDCLRTMDWQCSHEAALKHLKGVIALLRDQAALERKCATACMKRGKQYTTPEYRHAELAALWAEKAGCHQQLADVMVRLHQYSISLYNAMLKEDTALLQVLLQDAEAMG